ncbi:hypothetical protein [Pseudofrankia sp. DC12]|uniref:hypothetical protein n=1 Tax=Pseudofrankia sp. DC12 TaxID=683315 RepID=UPI0012F73160|nr:hypothetical protein [Pseudofrankia sp. DC12]
MAWEWVSPVAIATGTIITTTVTALRSRGDRRHADGVAASARADAVAAAAAARAHAKETAAEELKQRRIEPTYSLLLEWLGQQWRWARDIQPVYKFGEQSEPAPPATQELSQRLEGSLVLHGGDAVWELFKEYEQHLWNLAVCDRAIRTAIHPSESDEAGASRISELHAEVRRQKDAIDAIDKKLRRQVRLELSGVAPEIETNHWGGPNWGVA